MRDQETGELARVLREREEASEPQRDLAERREMAADVVGGHRVDRHRSPVLLAGRGLHVGEAHPEVAVGAGVDGALAPMRIGDCRRQPFAGLEVDDEPVLFEQPVDIAHDRDRHIVELDLDSMLIGRRDAVLAQLSQGVGDVARYVGSFALAPVFSHQRHLAVEFAQCRRHAFRDRLFRAHQTHLDAVLDRLATGGESTRRGPMAQQPLHHPQRRLGGPEIQRGRRQTLNAVASEGVAEE